MGLSLGHTKIGPFIYSIKSAVGHGHYHFEQVNINYNKTCCRGSYNSKNKTGLK